MLGKSERLLGRGKLHPLPWCPLDLRPRFREVCGAPAACCRACPEGEVLNHNLHRGCGEQSALPGPACCSAAGLGAACLPGVWVVFRRRGLPWLPRLTTAGPADPLEPVVPVPLSARSVTLRQDVLCGSGAADLAATRAQIRGNVVKPQCRGGWGKIPRVVINGISPPRCWVARAGSPGLTLPALSGSSVLPQRAGKGEQPLACLSQRGSAVPNSLPRALVPAAWNP